MKNTIKSDDHRIIIYSDYLNDNCKLEGIFDSENQNISIVTRYVDGVNKITETTLLVLSMDQFTTEYENLIRINEENDSIAIFEKKEEGYVLRDIYDTINHCMAVEDFKDVVFKNKFPQTELGKNLELIKKPNSGGNING